VFAGVQKMHILGKSIAFVSRRNLMWPKACEFFFIFFESIAFVARCDPVGPKPCYVFFCKVLFLLQRERARERKRGREGGMVG
jgi:hypothetical protein